MEYIVSVIIPVYNNKETLPETLDCILRQSVYDKTRIICVDDGSTDGSADILKKYSSAHSNIIIITKENGGVSSARNEGIKYAEGRYLIFLDADDLISGTDALDNLCSEMDKADADAGIFRLKTFGFGGNEYNPFADQLAKEKSISCTDTRLLWNFPVSNKIYKTSLIKENSLLFPDTVYTEDGAFWIEFVMKIQPRITGIYSAVSMYRQSDPRNHTQATQKTELKSISDFIKSCELIIKSITGAAKEQKISDEEKQILINEMHLRICHILINGFYRKILRYDSESISFLSEKYTEYSALLSSDYKIKLEAVDLPEINFSKDYIAGHPQVSIKVKNPSDRFISAILCQTTPWFEICTEMQSDFSFISNSVPKSKTIIRFNYNDEPDPRLISGIIKIRNRFPFLPAFLLKKIAVLYLRNKG